MEAEKYLIQAELYKALELSLPDFLQNHLHWINRCLAAEKFIEECTQFPYSHSKDYESYKEWDKLKNNPNKPTITQSNPKNPLGYLHEKYKPKHQLEEYDFVEVVEVHKHNQNSLTLHKLYEVFRITGYDTRGRTKFWIIDNRGRRKGYFPENNQFKVRTFESIDLCAKIVPETDTFNPKA